jgi:hypothetical protein
MRYLIVRCHYQLVNRTSKYFLPHIVEGEGLETSQFVFYSPVLGNPTGTRGYCLPALNFEAF